MVQHWQDHQGASNVNRGHSLYNCKSTANEGKVAARNSCAGGVLCSEASEQVIDVAHLIWKYKRIKDAISSAGAEKSWLKKG